MEAYTLNRVPEQGFPGVVWQPVGSPTATTGGTVVTDRTVNNTTVFAKIATTRRIAPYGVTLATTGSPTLTLNGAYAAGQLQVIISKDRYRYNARQLWYSKTSGQRGVIFGL